MWQTGEIVYSKQIGKTGTAKYQWQPCPICQKPRWVRLEGGKLRSKICAKCRGHEPHPKGDKSPLWKGGRLIDHKGYIALTLPSDDFYYPMTGKKRRYVFEHRLVMARHLGRCLHPWEIVHHKNGVRDDNKIGNLELSNKGAHLLLHSKGYRDGYQRGLTDGRLKQIQELQDEILRLHRLIKGY